MRAGLDYRQVTPNGNIHVLNHFIASAVKLPWWLAT